MAKVQAIRGMNDILPEQTPVWQYLEGTVRTLLSSYGYEEIRMPIVEQTDLFKRSIGEVTDIVEKEMYTFDDRNGDSLTLRPEGTAGCVRAGEQHSLFYKQTRRLWYAGPMFRHERPQKGRYRQFHQIGVETFGMTGPDIDAEIIAMTARLWRELGILDQVTLELNTLATADSRQRYKDALTIYLKEHFDCLDEDSKRRLDSNPLRILDSKDAATREVLEAAPSLHDYLDDESLVHFEGLKARLDSLGIAYQINPRLVRGLDYYGKTVFEWVTSALGSQGTVCAGGRYDGLVEQLGGKPTPAVGFAMGVERLVLLLEALSVLPEGLDKQADLYVVAAGEKAELFALKAAERLRAETSARVLLNCGGGSFKSQMKKADRSRADFAVVIGDNEAEVSSALLRPLRDGGEQQSLALDELVRCVAERYKN